MKAGASSKRIAMLDTDCATTNVGMFVSPGMTIGGHTVNHPILASADHGTAREEIAAGKRALEAIKNHKRFGFNFDPSHLGYQGVDYVSFLRKLSSRIYHVHMKDAWWGHGSGEAGVFGGHTTFGDPRRYWDFRSLGHGDINFEEIMVALNDIGYQGPLSVEWEDSRMDREHGAKESCEFVKKIDFKPSAIAFDGQFGNG